MKDNYKNKRIRSNMSLLIGKSETEKEAYLEMCKNATNRLVIVSFTKMAEEMFAGKKITPKKALLIQEQMDEVLKEAMKEGNNIMVDFPLLLTEERRAFVIRWHNYCREYKLRCSFTCIYFDDKTGNIEFPSSEEGWNDILLIDKARNMRQIVIHYNVNC